MSLISLNEIKKPTGKFLRLLARQLRLKILEKLLKFAYENLNGKLTFYQFCVRSIFQELSFYSALKKCTILYICFVFRGIFQLFLRAPLDNDRRRERNNVNECVLIDLLRTKRF